MRKLKLQMQVSLDGFVAGPKGEMDWMVWDWDDGLKNYVRGITDPVDCILLGRVLAQGFIDAWANIVANPASAPNEDQAGARKMNDTPKVVFSRTLKTAQWKNTRLNNRDLAEEIVNLKKQPGKDIIAYGGASFVSDLIKLDLIDEYHIFVNPAVLGNGMPIFKSLNAKRKLKLMKTFTSGVGIVVLCYVPI